MADYYPLLAKAVSGQTDSTPETRRQIYDRARKALLGQLRNMNPPVPEADVDRESDALDNAIARLEAELAPPPAAVEKPPAPGVEGPPPLPPPTVKEPPADVVAPPPPAPPEVPPPPVEPAPEIAPPGSETAQEAVAPRIEPKPQLSAPRIEPTPEIDSAPPIAPPQRPQRASLPPLPPIPPRAPTARPRIPAPASAPPSKAKAPEDSKSAEAASASQPSFTEPPAAVPPTPDETQMRFEGIRPVAPQPRATQGNNLRYGVLAAVLVAIVGGIAALAMKLKDRPEDIVRARPQAATESTTEPAKIIERVGAGSTAPVTPPRPAQPTSNMADSGGTPAQPAIPVAQRAALLVEAPEEPQKFKTYVGTVVWRIENAPRGAGQPLSQAVRAEADIGEAGLRLSVLFQRNTDEAIPASHIMNLSFTLTPGGPAAAVDEIDLPQMRNEVAPAVDPLFGVPAKITQNLFLVGLAKDQTLAVRNVEMLRSRGWLDIPMRLADGRLAKITLEKGPAGDRAISDALAAWGQ